MLADYMANHKKQDMRVHTFGIGNDFDADLVGKTAKIGRGSCSYAYVDDKLPGQVITALKRALAPSLHDCTFSWGNNSRPVKIAEMFRDESFTSYKIMS